MISIKPIPLDLRADRILGRDEPGLEAFARENAWRIQPSACFEELDAAGLGLGQNGGDIWEPTVIAGLCSLGPESAGTDFRSDSDREAWRLIREAALSDCLDLVEYRVRQYLKPTGRKPGTRLIPGCEDLPLAFNRMIIDRFGPDCSAGLTTEPSGELSGAFGLVFVYPAADRPGSDEARCAHCARKHCLGRAGISSSPTTSST